MAPLRVAVFLADQNPHRDRSLGITEMTRSLFAQLKRRDDIQLIPVVSRSSFQDRELLSESVRLPWRTDGRLGRLLSDAVHPWLTRRAIDVWYYPKGYVSWLARPTTPMVGTMHDAIVQYYIDHYAGWRSARDLDYWTMVTKRSLKYLDLVLTVSEHSRGQLLEFCDRHRVRHPRIEVTYEGSDWERYRTRSFIKQDHVVHLASDAPHKQTNQLLALWEAMQRARDASSLPALRLIGKLDAEGSRRLQGLRNASLSPRLSHEALVECLGSARALILSSAIEGFGLPALEAYYVGTPVCYVAGTSVAEVVGGGGAWGAYDPHSLESFAMSLDRALDMAESEIAAIRDSRYQKFSCERIADQLAVSLRHASD